MNETPSSELDYLRKRLDELSSEVRERSLGDARPMGFLEGQMQSVMERLERMESRLDRLIEEGTPQRLARVESQLDSLLALLTSQGLAQDKGQRPGAGGAQ